MIWIEIPDLRTHLWPDHSFMNHTCLRICPIFCKYPCLGTFKLNVLSKITSLKNFPRSPVPALKALIRFKTRVMIWKAHIEKRSVIFCSIHAGVYYSEAYRIEHTDCFPEKMVYLRSGRLVIGKMGYWESNSRKCCKTHLQHMVSHMWVQWAMSSLCHNITLFTHVR